MSLILCLTLQLLASSVVVGLTRLELVTPRLSSVCSNQLSYRPSDTSYEEQLVVDSYQSSIFR